MNDIVYNLVQVWDKIFGVVVLCGCVLEEVILFVVSKMKFVSVIEEVIVVGQWVFGENYVQEGVEKINYFQQVGVSGLQWYFIGFLQFNKSWLVVEYFDWCYIVDWLKIVICLNEQCLVYLLLLKVLI